MIADVKHNKVVTVEATDFDSDLFNSILRDCSYYLFHIGLLYFPGGWPVSGTAFGIGEFQYVIRRQTGLTLNLRHKNSTKLWGAAAAC